MRQAPCHVANSHARRVEAERATRARVVARTRVVARAHASVAVFFLSNHDPTIESFFLPSLPLLFTHTTNENVPRACVHQITLTPTLSSRVARARRGVGGTRAPTPTMATTTARVAAARARVASSSAARATRGTPPTTRPRRATTRRATRDAGDDEDARAIDDAIETLEARAAREIEAMMTSDAGVRAEAERARRDARDVAEREIEKVEQMERERVRTTFEEVQMKTEASQSRAERAAEETLALKRDAVERAEAKMRALEAERAALREELAKEDASGGDGAGGKWADGASIDEAAEKAESAKSAAVGGASGALLATPLIVSQGGGLVSVGIVAVSCAVFGVTYRYAVRRDLGNNELKGGVVGAFGLARGLSAADVYLRAASLNGDADFATYAQAALLAGQGVLTYAFAALALEQAFARGILKPFGEAPRE